jgi:acyl carrier protein
MSNKPSDSIADEVSRVVVQLLADRAPSKQIAIDEPLTAIGLDSLGMVNLFLEIETRFNVTIPARLVNPKNFRSINSISRLIEGITLAA